MCQSMLDKVPIKDAVSCLIGNGRPFGSAEYRTVKRYAHKVLGAYRVPSDLQEDLIQDVLLQVSQASNVLEPVAYFRTSLKNALFASARRKKTLLASDLTAADADEPTHLYGTEFDEHAFQAAVWTEYGECLDTVFSKLSKDQLRNVDVFVGQKIDEQSFAELSERTGRTSSALRTALSSFAKTWQSMIESTCPDIPPRFRIQAALIHAASQNNPDIGSPDHV